MLTPHVILQLLIIGLTNGSIIALNAIAVTLIYSAVRTINLAHGDLFGLITVLVTTLISALGLRFGSPPLALIAGLGLTLVGAVLFGAMLSALIERIAFQPFRSSSRLAPLIATLGLSFVLFQAALFWRYTFPSWTAGRLSHHGVPEVPTEGIPEVFPTTNLLGGFGLHVVLTFKDVLVLLSAVACALGVGWLLQKMRTGKAIRAVAQNQELARICGVDPDAVIRQTFVLGGALAGIAAFAFATYYTRPFGIAGPQSGLVAFTAAILGGVGNPVGALVAALVLGISAAFSDYFLAAQWTPVLIQMLLIGLLLLRPSGIILEERAEEPGSSQNRDTLTWIASGQRVQLNPWLMWGGITLALVYPALDTALGLRWQLILATIGIFVLLALGLNVLLGVAGLLDLGYAVSFGIGGYVTAMLTNRWSGIGAILPQPMDFLLVFALSAILAGLFGALNGPLSFRLRSDYLAVVTLALGLMARQILINLRDLTGGAGGIPVLPPPHILTYTLTNAAERYYLVFGLAVVATVVSRRLIGSRVGRAWLAIGQDETAAASCGISPAHYKTLAFTISSAMAGAAGALYASIIAYIDPELVDFHISAMVLAMVILGGAGSVPGAILGAITIAGFDRLIIPRLGELLANFESADLRLSLRTGLDVRNMSFLTFGLALYLTVFFRARRH